MGNNISSDEKTPKNITQPKYIIQNGLIYFLNEEDQTAGVAGIDSANGDIFIPRSVKCGEHEFIVTRIMNSSFQNSNSIKSVQFPPDSQIKIIEDCAFKGSSLEKITIPNEVIRICDGAFAECFFLKKFETLKNSQLQTIEEYAFAYSSITSISLPSSAINIGGGIGCLTHYLSDIKIIQNNVQNFKIYNDEFIIGKSDAKTDEFDVLVFCRRDIKTVTIPSFIKQIGPFSFCQSLIENIFIPPHVIEISKGAFYHCYDIKNIEIPDDSNLKIIGPYAFYNILINKIRIPKSVTNIGANAFEVCYKLQLVEIPADSELQIIGKYAFAGCSFRSFLIPPHLKEIDYKVFEKSTIKL